MTTSILADLQKRLIDAAERRNLLAGMGTLTPKELIEYTCLCSEVTRLQEVIKKEKVGTK